MHQPLVPRCRGSPCRGNGQSYASLTDWYTMCNMTRDNQNISANIIECGPVLLSTEDLRNPRAFKHRQHPLSAHLDAYCMSVETPSPLAIDICDTVWRNLVAEHLVPRVSVPITLAHGAYNSAYARLIDGLTENEEALAHLEVSVPAHLVAAAFLEASTSPHPIEPAHPVSHRPSLLENGLAALAGRYIEITFQGAVDGIVGRCLACKEGTLILASSDTLHVIPVPAIAYASTMQCTIDEVDALR